MKHLGIIGGSLAVAAASWAAGSQEGTGPAEPPRYGRTPADLVPFRRIEPYWRYFTEPPAFHGPGREHAEPADLREIAIGVLVPAPTDDYDNYDAILGARMERGVALAFEEANVAGGYRGCPYRLITRHDTGPWGAAANEVVRFAVDDGVWAILGSVADENNHVIVRSLLKVEVPLVNTAGTDPTLTEHAIPWFIHVRSDDRQNSYLLAREVFRVRGHRQVAILRTGSRYGRAGHREFLDAAKRLGRPIGLEVRYRAADPSAASQIERIKAARADAVVVWGNPAELGRFVAEIRKAGLTVPVYGPDRLVDDSFLKAAGAAAEGVTATYPFDPTHNDPRWLGFVERFGQRYGVEPDQAAAYGYDGARLLLEAIARVGLNRPRIRDALMATASFEGVTGTALMDATGNNVASPVLATVKGGKFVFGQ